MPSPSIPTETRVNADSMAVSGMGKSVLNSMQNPTKKYAPPANTRTKGTGDTETQGAFNGRYVHYRDMVKKGILNPTVNAFRKVNYKGKKLGTTTAQEFLNAMVNEQLLIKGLDGKGRTVYSLKVANHEC